MGLSAGYTHNNFIGSRKVKGLFKDKPYEVSVKNIDINGQKRGCSGFITNTSTGKVCYITTEPFFDGGKGSGLWRDENKGVMMRTAKNTKDYTGGTNQFLNPKQIVKFAERLTR